MLFSEKFILFNSIIWPILMHVFQLCFSINYFNEKFHREYRWKNTDVKICVIIMRA